MGFVLKPVTKLFGGESRGLGGRDLLNQAESAKAASTYTPPPAPAKTVGREGYSVSSNKTKKRKGKSSLKLSDQDTSFSGSPISTFNVE